MKILPVFLTASILSLSGFNLKAQSGAKLQVGLNLANVSVTNNGRVNSANTLTSFQLGITADAHIGNIFYFQPGLIYNGKGSKTESVNQTSGNYFKATSNPFYIEMPLNFVIKAPLGSGNKFFAGAGPYIAVGIGGKNKVEGSYLGAGFNSENSIRFSNDDPTTFNYEEGAGLGILKRFDYGLNGLAGFEGKSLSLGVNYGLGLAKLQSGTNSGSDNNNKHRVFSIILGIKF